MTVVSSEPRTPATVPVSGRPPRSSFTSTEPAGSLESNRACPAISSTTGQIASITGFAELPGRERAARDLGQHRRPPLRAFELRVEQPLADAPLLEVVELDRQRIGDLVREVTDADPEPLAQERPHRPLDEPDEVLELDRPFPR